jgi:glutamyl/glutaminyl-tRNA synthetase
MSKQVRVRFAPSPTGPYILAAFVPHYLFAKKNNGVFFLLKIRLRLFRVEEYMWKL